MARKRIVIVDNTYKVKRDLKHIDTSHHRRGCSIGNPIIKFFAATLRIKKKSDISQSGYKRRSGGEGSNDERCF